MSEAKKSSPEISPTRFLIYIGIGLLTLILCIIGLGAALTYFLQPEQNHPSYPIIELDSEQAE